MLVHRTFPPLSRHLSHAPCCVSAARLLVTAAWRTAPPTPTRTAPPTATAALCTGLGEPGLVHHAAYVDGRWVHAAGGRTVGVADPATLHHLGDVPDMDGCDAAAAVVAAHDAFGAWSKWTPKRRCAVLRRWFELIREHQRDLAVIMVREQGKPLAEAMGEIAYAASFVEWFAEEGKRTYGEVIPSPASDRRLLTFKQPVGVCAAITPWNFPSAMLTRKAAPALAAGCTMVVKPSELTPYSAIALVELAERAGVPAGVLNLVTCSATNTPKVGLELSTHPHVKKVTFTGSTGVGKLLLRQAASTVKKVTLELGGNAPFIVFEDADMDAAVQGAIAAKFRNSGQTCVCTNRFFVHAAVYDSFVERFAAEVGALRVGNGFEEGVTQGPLINEAAVQKVLAQVEDAVQKGGRLVVGGERHALNGTFMQPTVISGATSEMLVTHEETFGPLAAVYKFDNEQEVIFAANDTPFGLAAYFYTRDMARVWRVSEALDYGMVGVNAGVISTEVAPFGGMKESGLGREGAKQGIDEYLNVKYVAHGGL